MCEEKRQQIISKGLLGIFLLSFLCFFVPLSSFAAQTSPSSGSAVTVHLRVLFSPQFAFVVGKNSKIVLDKEKINTDEEILIRVYSYGAKDSPLKNQKLELSVKNLENGSEINLPEGEEINPGEVTFKINQSLLTNGKYQISAINETYEKPILLQSNPIFTVENANNGQDKLLVWNILMEKFRSWFGVA